MVDHVLVGVVGLAGALSGVNNASVSTSEIGVSYPDATFGTESRIGTPFVFVLRSILARDQSLAAATRRLFTTKRTCDLVLGVGDGKVSTYNAFAYSSSDLTVVTPDNFLPANSTWHAPLPDIVYHGMDWICPSFNSMYHTVLAANYGALTAPLMIEKILGPVRSGDNHIAVYDYTTASVGTLYVGFSAPLGATGKVAAYDRQFAKFDLATLFAEAPPTA